MKKNLQQYASNLFPLLAIFLFLIAILIFSCFHDSIARLSSAILFRMNETPEYTRQAAEKPNTQKKHNPKEKLSVSGLQPVKRQAGTVQRSPGPLTEPPLLKELHAPRNKFIADSCLRNWACLPPVPAETENQDLKTLFTSIPHAEFEPGKWNGLTFTDFSGSLDLAKAFPGLEKKPAVIRLCTVIETEKEYTDALLLFSLDGMLSVRLNGKEVYHSPATCVFRRNSPFAVSVTIPQGKSVLQLKLAGNTKNRMLNIRITDHESRPVYFAPASQSGK